MKLDNKKVVRLVHQGDAKKIQAKKSDVLKRGVKEDYAKNIRCRMKDMAVIKKNVMQP